MAKGGESSRVGKRPAKGDTSRRLVNAAIEALRYDGFAGASARVIAGRAGCNQALVFYHFGSVANLLLAALDETSARRMDRYRDAVATAGNLSDLAGVAADIYREDLDAGHITVLSEMIAGASSTPGLGEEVAARIEPWIDFTEATLRRFVDSTPIGQLVPVRDAAFAIIALYLGVEMLSHLGDERTAAESLLTTTARLSTFLTALSATAPNSTGSR
ncbi:MAG: TetR/AcrR family transcriptional regulator [Acidimicrobiales bacterium]